MGRDRAERGGLDGAHPSRFGSVRVFVGLFGLFLEIVDARNPNVNRVAHAAAPRGERVHRGVGEVSHSEKKRETVQTRAERSAGSKGCSDGENLTGVQLVPLPVSPS